MAGKPVIVTRVVDTMIGEWSGSLGCTNVAYMLPSPCVPPSHPMTKSSPNPNQSTETPHCPPLSQTHLAPPVLRRPTLPTWCWMEPMAFC